MNPLGKLVEWCLVTTVRAHVDVGILHERKDLYMRPGKTCLPNG